MGFALRSHSSAATCTYIPFERTDIETLGHSCRHYGHTHAHTQTHTHGQRRHRHTWNGNSCMSRRQISIYSAAHKIFFFFHFFSFFLINWIDVFRHWRKDLFDNLMRLNVQNDYVKKIKIWCWNHTVLLTTHVSGSPLFCSPFFIVPISEYLNFAQ